MAEDQQGPEDPFKLFSAGADRYASYQEGSGPPAEPGPVPVPVIASAPEPEVSVLPVPLAASVAGQVGARRVPWWRWWSRNRFPTVEDQAQLAADETAIRQWTAPRSRNVLVANIKSSGKTGASLTLGGLIAETRGGSVAITEATPMAGDLAARAEGRPTIGLGELVKSAHLIRSVGELSAFTAPQSSLATVVGSPTDRSPMGGQDVMAVRRVLDTYYQLTITDTANATVDMSFRTALATADAVVVPVVCSLASIRGAQVALRAVAEYGTPGLLSRVVVIASHDGGHEDPGLAADYIGICQGLGHPVLEVPFDPALRNDSTEFSISSLSKRSRYAWTRVAATVIETLKQAPADQLVPDHSAGHTPNATTTYDNSRKAN